MTEEKRRTIRAFRDADVPALKTLIDRTVDACYPGHYCPAAVRFFKDYHDEQAILKDARAGHTIVLTEAGRIIGTGTLVGDEIKRVFLDPSLHRQGAGRLIMHRLEEEAAAAAVTTVKLDASLPSKAFYDRLNYVTVERTFLPLANGQRLEFFKMQKRLP
jgi:GNAT superfamily N-acetyltransferase